MKLLKTKEELYDYMWELYPRDDQQDIRVAMAMTFDFLTGRLDKEEKERVEIQELVNQIITE